MSDQNFVAITGSIAVLVLMLIRVPIAVSLGSVSLAGVAYLVGPGPAFGILTDSPIRTVTNFNFSVIPMFILMGAVVGASGMSRELFRAANAWLGHLPGGMGLATIFACGGFAAISGSSIAAAATMTKVALPEMRRAGYNPGLAAGIVAAGGTLDIMIPPSVLMVIYCILTESDLVALFLAGFIPGIIAVVFYCVAILIVYYYHPTWLPRGHHSDWIERFDSLKDIWATLLLFVVVIGGIYSGFVTVTEAAGLGVFGAVAIGVARRALPWPVIVATLVEALRTSAAIFYIVIAAFLFQYFLAYTQMAVLLGDFLQSFNLGMLGIVIGILAFYIVAGMFVDEIAMILLTIPIFFPIVTGLGADPIWFGILVIVTVQIGLICPPVGIICFIMNNMVPDIGLVNIYKGAMPFVLADLVWLALLVAFPMISLWLPKVMGQL
jgi:tripartite ATP-independent transporter DctM subunit